MSQTRFKRDTDVKSLDLSCGVSLKRSLQLVLTSITTDFESVRAKTQRRQFGSTTQRAGDAALPSHFQSLLR